MAGIAYRRIGDWRTQAPQQLRIQLAQQESTIEQLVQLGRQQGLTLDEHQEAIEALQQSTAQMRSELDALQAYTPVSCQVHFGDNNTATTISSVNTYVQVTQENWTLDAGGSGFELGGSDVSLVYTGETGRRVLVTIGCGLRIASGTLVPVRARVESNGSGSGITPYTPRTIIAQASTEQEVTMAGLVTLTNGDEFTLEVRNDSGTANITVARFAMQMVEVH